MAKECYACKRPFCQYCEAKNPEVKEERLCNKCKERFERLNLNTKEEINLWAEQNPDSLQKGDVVFLNEGNI